MARPIGFSIFIGLLGAMLLIEPAGPTAAQANGVFKAAPKKAAAARSYRRCSVGRYDPHCGCCETADPGVFYPYRYYYSRYPYYAEPFPHGFWWW
jgi:hypothetical protein